MNNKIELLVLITIVGLAIFGTIKFNDGRYIGWTIFILVLYLSDKPAKVTKKVVKNEKEKLKEIEE